MSDAPGPHVQLRVTGAPTRLDQFLVTHWPARIGRRALAALLARADVRVNGRRARKSTRVQAGDAVRIDVPPPAAPAPPASRRLPLVHAGRAAVAVDKPPGMPSTEGPSRTVSVAELLVARYPGMAGLDGPRSAGLVHRLDTATSGLLLAARDAATHTALRRAFRTRAVRKHYLALVRGCLRAPRTVEQPLQRRHHGGRMHPARPGQRRTWPAVTRIRPLRAAPDATLVHLTMRTGVTHQLRAHLASIGHPVLGDRRYGSAHLPPPSARLTTHVEPAWHFLHAAAIALEVPGVPSRLRTDVPAHWHPLLAALGWSIDTGALEDD